MTDFQNTVLTQKPTKIECVGEGKFDAHLATYANGWQAIIKKDKQGKRFRRLRTDRMHLREAAFYRFSQLIYPGIVPETYVTKIKGEPCSAQMFVPGFHLRKYDPELFTPDRDDFYDNMRKVCYHAAPKEVWKRLSLLDLVGNSRDRHGKNVLVRPKREIPLAAIDNGASLGKTFRCYRSVFHRYLLYWHFYAPEYVKQLSTISLQDIKDAIVPLLAPEYAEHAMRRIEWVLEFPHRLPWRIISKGEEKRFPSYKAYFSSSYRRLPQRPLIVKAA